MARSLIIGALATTMVFYTAVSNSQSIKDRLNAVTEGLNDPDSIVRLVTYEEAVKSGDATVKRVALRTALQSADTDLRALALRGAFTDRNLVSFRLSRNDEFAAALEAAGDEKEAIEQVKKEFQYSEQMQTAYSNTVSIQITKYEYQTGNIAGFCLNALSKKDDRYKVMGTISGDEITLQSSCYASAYSKCTLNAELADSGKLKGRLNCSYQGANANAELDLL